jgi:hypothetical protein
MGIDATVESEDGEVEAELPDPQDLTDRLVAPFRGSDSPCLRFVDPYGNTTFNGLQLRVLIGELERAIQIAPHPQVKSHGEALLALARQASAEVHTYLKFTGD